MSEIPTVYELHNYTHSSKRYTQRLQINLFNISWNQWER